MASGYTVSSTIGDVLKVRYPENEIMDYGYRQQAILPFLEKVRRGTTGKNYSFSVLLHAGNDSQFMAEDGTIITPTGDQYKRGYVDPTTLITTQTLSQESISDSATIDGSLFAAAVQVPKRIAKRHAFKIAANAWSLDAYGAWAVCGSSASTTVQLATNANMRKFWRGQVVDLRIATTGVIVSNGDSITITAIDETNKTITYSGSAATVTVLNSVYCQDELTDTPTAYAWKSIPALVGEGSIQNIDPATYPEFKSGVNTATGSLTAAKLQKGVDWSEARYEGYKNGGTKGLVMYCSPEVFIKSGDLILGDVRYSPDDLKKAEFGYPTDMIYRGGTMGPIPLVKDNLMPIDEMYLLNPSAFRLWTSAWWQWMDAGGSKFIPSATTLGYLLRFFSRGQMAIIDRPSCYKWQVIGI